MGRGLLEDERGQVSAELIIVIAALMAVAMIFVNGLTTTVTEASAGMKTETTQVLGRINEI